MLKRNKNYILLTALLTSAPMLAGLLLWNQLPDTIATHFDLNGVPNGWSSKPFTVFGLPLFLVALHLLCAFVTLADPRKKNIQEKLYRMVLWICPLCALIVCGSVYPYALGMAVDVSLVGGLFVGVLFLVVGNYLPKCRQNYTMGIKLPWTLSDEENWNHTHRFAGWLWMAGGGLLLLLTLLDRMSQWLLLGIIAAMVALPTVYSILYYLRHKTSCADSTPRKQEKPRA